VNNENLFPDYKPKKTLDTVHDYLQITDSVVFKILRELEKSKLKSLKKILEYLNKYKIKAKKIPGGYKQGNIVIGADLDQYYPSEE
jgi:hypothetical protein